MPQIFTADHWIALRQTSDARISPDGELIAFVMGDSFKEGGPSGLKMPRSAIHAVPTRAGPARRLTFGPGADTTPRWSPDGRLLAFLSDRAGDGQRQVHILDRSGGEARRLTSVSGAIPSPRSLSPLEWTPDGKSVVFLKEDDEPSDARSRREAGDDAIEFERNPRYLRLWFADAETGNARCVSPEAVQVWEFAVSPDGASVAAIASDLPFEQDWYFNRLVVFESGGPARTVHQSHRQLAKPAWSPNGAAIACLTSNWSDRGVDAGDIVIIQAGTAGSVGVAAARNATRGHDVSYERFEWSADGSKLIAAANHHAGAGIAEIDAASGERRWLWTGREHLSGFSRDSTGRFATAIEAPDRPPEVFTADPPGEADVVPPPALDWKRITNLYPETREYEIANTSEVHWAAPDGLELHGLFLTPPGAPGGPLPTVMLVHGGPTNADRLRYQPLWRWAQVIACRGFAVFQPNYRGSTGWGLDFAESNIGDMGGRDFQDMLAGLDHLVESGLSDGRRLGIAGSSYGGFTAMWAVTQTQRFRAAVAIAGISDWRSFHGRSYLHTWDRIHYGGADPYDPAGLHARFSPIAHIKNARTPSLILHGELDWDVPVEQSYQFYRALKDLGVETELVVYPREPHGLTEKAHLLDAARRIPDWFERWLLD